MKKEKRYQTECLYFPKRVTMVLERILEHPLTVIEAPMGYGKTTAVREFLNSAGVNMLWQRVYDHSLVNFWKGFARLFRDFDGVRSQNLVELGFPGDAGSIEEAIRLIEDIKLPDKTVVVVDDYHLTDSAAVNSFMELLAEHEIENLHIVLTARFVKFQRLEELALKGYLLHLSKDTFEFRPQEIRRYYNICGVTLSDDEARQLYSDTEGWISALYLIMLEYAAGDSYSPVKSIYKLLEKAVYLPLPDEIKEFVVTMSIFDSFTVEQAAYVWGKDNTVELLAALTVNNSFIRYDSRLKSYHIHSLFSVFLKEVLSQKENDHKQNLYCKAARWFMKKGDGLTARRFFYQGGDFDGILLALEKDKSSDYSAAHKDLLKQYLAECPAKVRSRHHYALLIYAMHLFVHKELELLHQIC